MHALHHRHDRRQSFLYPHTRIGRLKRHPQALEARRLHLEAGDALVAIGVPADRVQRMRITVEDARQILLRAQLEPLDALGRDLLAVGISVTSIIEDRAVRLGHLDALERGMAQDIDFRRREARHVRFERAIQLDMGKNPEASFGCEQF